MLTGPKPAKADHRPCFDRGEIRLDREYNTETVPPHENVADMAWSSGARSFREKRAGDPELEFRAQELRLLANRIRGYRELRSELGVT